MTLLEQETKLFIHHKLLTSEIGTELLRSLLSSTMELANHSIIADIIEDHLEIIPQTPAQQNFSLTDTAFQYFVEQKAMDGFIYGSVKSFKSILGV